MTQHEWRQRHEKRRQRCETRKMRKWRQGTVQSRGKQRGTRHGDEGK